MSFNEAALQYIQTARDNGLLFNGSDVPAMVDYADEKRKSYLVRGAHFEVPSHFEVLNAVGYGAYGVVCAAVDLRLVPSSTSYNAALRQIEKEGQFVTRQARNRDPPVYYRTRCLLASAAPGRSVHVPNLYSEPYKRRALAGGEPSPFVAMKKVSKVFDDLVDGRRILREVKVLRYLQGHPNVIRLLEVRWPPPAAGGASSTAALDDVYLVTELMDTDLAALLKSSQQINMEQLRFIAYQLIKVLVYVHSSGVMHRDLKPGNVLLNGDCDMKLCDFGLSRGGIPLSVKGRSSSGSTWSMPDPDLEEMSQWEQLCWSSGPPEPQQPVFTKTKTAPLYSLTDYVVTRYYRAPELLVMSRYNHAIDMWSVGCILAEMLLRRPLFAGTNYLSQLTLILETPGLRAVPHTPEQVAALFDGGEEGKHLISDLLFFRNTPPTGASQTVRGQVHSQALFHSAVFGSNADVPVELGILVAKLLSFDPQKRPTAVEALRDPFFRPLYDARDEIVRSPAMDVSEVQECIPDIAAYQRMHPCVVQDEAPPFTWEFDHRITSSQSLRALFQEECAASMDVQRQIKKQNPATDTPFSA
ncbi:putative mitogen-activated protein kinase 7 [Leptomonas pyrrhocoris]|uniref:non-specific serine/threonine protein kinase n=1 Tax=Leptomonas pyrrhocoris TaxID=157538 RepID=A0A0N0DSZ6_LEPPY|nr:putative mitogen-activated protein kinase 7 [Leptomonas pyrrhocoris]XP_015654771.1 putative mitogen-activated protein kinase 7 [Leptomonas pyrrhocoris]KPA76331.1 putative mitogen-activated protein kinase 7 [Leptomonas pyrrhocoris]KPA76332.1 putative mitogen-activated protein kinase 7 [Leptomonas pyrrhocoris]|eukprot:XP_015654770.1 putative mitogen-activated protein kinase 7 [Leptomonas pyrrhocoris]